MTNNSIRLSILDILACIGALYLSFLIRFEFNIPTEFFNIFKSWIPWFSLIQVFVFFLSGLYARLWRYTSLFDLYAIVSSVLTSAGLSIIIVLLNMGTEGYPRSVLVLYVFFDSIAVIGLRLSVRVYFSHYKGQRLDTSKTPLKTLLLIGAGKTGEKIAREIRTTSSYKYALAGYVDDNPEKYNALIHGKRVFGSIRDLLHLDVKYDELLITVPSATGDQMRQIVRVCKKTGKKYKTVPGIAELIDREVSLDKIRDVSYSDLLRREEVKLDMNSIQSLLKGKRILITGAGGSIGLELVKQCLKFEPAELICLDFNEEKIYNLESFFYDELSKVTCKSILASICNKWECDKVFLDNRPQIVFHAAAYKHVPIQETHPWKAVNTNIGGTVNLVELSDKYGVEKFVLVSTDKAVNPTNIMGATKQAAEKVVQSYNQKSDTMFMAVRFGNVLGSSGSAIPTFQKQINKGGPVTITHPQMTRYFMSIQEASQLILQCGALGNNGEVFLLEMGRPIKITEMVNDLIRLSGLEPEVDIPIVFSGLRPGEKLYEELQMFNESKVGTEHKKIMVLKDKDSPESWDVLKISILTLLDVAKQLDSEQIQLILKQMLPTYSPKIFKTTHDQFKISKTPN